MKRILVTGAGGFIGGHLAAYLKEQGHEVFGVDIKHHEFRSRGYTDFFGIVDLRSIDQCDHLLMPEVDCVYHLAANMGGMGWIHGSELGVMADNIAINQNIISWVARHNIPRLFFSSSVCIYRNMQPGESELSEEDAYPAMPDNEYGWEKLFAERLFMTYARHHDIQVRIARFQNCYGPFGTYDGGREKAPAALCRKVAQAENDGAIDVWGDGTALRNFVYVEDLVRAIVTLMESDVTTPVNIGTDAIVSVNDLANIITRIAGKRLKINHVPGPVGVQARYFSNNKIKALGWEPNFTIWDGLTQTYQWIESEIKGEQNEPE